MHPGDPLLGRIRIVTPDPIRKETAQRAEIGDHPSDGTVVAPRVLRAVKTRPRLAPGFELCRVPKALSHTLIHPAQCIEARCPASRV